MRYRTASPNLGTGQSWQAFSTSPLIVQLTVGLSFNKENYFDLNRKFYTDLSWLPASQYPKVFQLACRATPFDPQDIVETEPGGSKRIKEKFGVYPLIAAEAAGDWELPHEAMEKNRPNIFVPQGLLAEKRNNAPLVNEDLDYKLYCLQPKHRMRNASLEEFAVNCDLRVKLYNVHSAFAPAVLNFLDIPMSGSLTSFWRRKNKLDPFPNMESNSTTAHDFATPFPHRHLSWALVASEGAVSCTHMDANGFPTHIRCVKGRKAWIIGRRKSNNPELCFWDATEEQKFQDRLESVSDKIMEALELAARNGEVPDMSEIRISRAEGNENRYMSRWVGILDEFMYWRMVILEPGDDL